jgi:hypothetical protein
MGYAFEIENYQEMIWASIINRENDEEAVDGLFRNGPDVPKNIDDLINKAWDRFVWVYM